MVPLARSHPHLTRAKSIFVKNKNRAALSSPIKGEDAKEPKESSIWLNGISGQRFAGLPSELAIAIDTSLSQFGSAALSAVA